MGFSKMVDMEMDDEERLEATLPIAMPDAKGPQYPWGLRISLTQDDLRKLGLLDCPCDVGDVIDLRAFAEVTSISRNKVKPVAGGEETEQVRIELQIQKLAIENESTEQPGEDDDD